MYESDRFDRVYAMIHENIPHVGQDPEELVWFAWRVHSIAPKRILEIGSRTGGSLVMLASTMERNNGKIVSVDLPEGPWGSKDSKRHLGRSATFIQTMWGD